MSLAFQINRLNFKQCCPSDKNKSRLNWYAANCKWNSLVHLVSQNQESWPNRAHTRGKSYYTPKASPRGERLTHFMLVQLSPHNQCGTNPNNPSTTDQPDTSTHGPHTHGPLGLGPTPPRVCTGTRDWRRKNSIDKMIWTVGIQYWKFETNTDLYKFKDSRTVYWGSEVGQSKWKAETSSCKPYKQSFMLLKQFWIILHNKNEDINLWRVNSVALLFYMFHCLSSSTILLYCKYATFDKV